MDETGRSGRTEKRGGAPRASGPELFDHQIEEASDPRLEEAPGRIDRHDVDVRELEVGEDLAEPPGGQVPGDQEVREKPDAQPGDGGVPDGLAAVEPQAAPT